MSVPPARPGARGLFVTGTDTGVGKTLVAAMLLRGLVADGRRAVGMKPVAAGIAPGAALNEDVETLIAAGNVASAQADINPYAFAAPVAPHVAAAWDGVRIDLATIGAAYRRLAGIADAIVVEGAGGAMTPLCAQTDMLDIARELGLPVVLVVGVRLGCLNHALLSAAAVAARGLHLAGWIANRIDPEMAAADASIATLDRRLASPRVADIAWRPAGTGIPPIRRAALVTLGLAD